jgi:hypothetical protein
MPSVEEAYPRLDAFSTIILGSFEPAIVEAADFLVLGKVDSSSIIRSPGQTVYSFETHRLTVGPGQFELVALHPLADGLAQHREAVTSFLDAYAAPRSVSAIGYNPVFRLTPTSGRVPSEVLNSLVPSAVLEAVGGTDAPELGLRVLFYPAIADGGWVTMEPSRVDDLSAVYFGLNYHFAMSGTSRTFDQVLRAIPGVIEDARHIVGNLLSAADEP